ncbi:hypothetical protein [Chryseobacterium vrystaatense]|uniref:Uncharacterized protein n=1 Tax=Chryseobacterium vrystaatense TaxID=307480 RepID=A0A1M5IKT5_9FLAO|nr:hypothetical protein [Chryseobacterium vrystaatense]SHG28974.1 hypothetical protein SAMN02787073_3908 [Chryseobacterium vrystaatense]
MKAIPYLYLVLAFQVLSCKGQNKDEQINKEKATQKISIINKTFLGVTKEKNSYSIINRCDGGYPLLKIFEKTLYYYYPQEGSYHTIKNISKINDGEYKIKTDGYYYFKNDTPMSEKKTWILSRKNDLTWEFSENDNGRKILLSDSLNVVSKKIGYRNLPCNDDNDEINADDKTNLISAKWFGKYQTSFTTNKKSNDSRDTDMVELIIKKDSIIFHVDRYWGEYNYLLQGSEIGNTIQLRFGKVLNGDETDTLEKNKNFGSLIFNGKKYYWQCPYIGEYYNNKKNKFLIDMIK